MQKKSKNLSFCGFRLFFLFLISLTVASCAKDKTDSPPAVSEENVQEWIKSEYKLNARLPARTEILQKLSFENCVKFRCLNAEENIIAAFSELLTENRSEYAESIAETVLSYWQSQSLPLKDELHLYTLWLESLGLNTNSLLSTKDPWSQLLSKKTLAEIESQILSDKSKNLILSRSIPDVSPWLEIKSILADDNSEDEEELPSDPEALRRLAKKLATESTAVDDYLDGDYSKASKIYMYCRKSRLHPCLMIVKKGDGSFHTTHDGKVWSHKSLALSSRREDPQK